MRHAEQTVRQSGRAFTRIRRHVYELLLYAEIPLGAYDMVDKLDGVGCAQPATAYRALYCLENLGLVRKIKSVSKYVPIARPHPEASIAFVVCRECGAAEQVTLELDSQPLLARARACGFQTLDLMIEFTGYCSDHQTSEFS